jgi:molybdopterin converting factor small subunit
MKVTITFLGLLREYIGQETVVMDFCHGAVYGDLLREIDVRYGKRLPESLWDKQACQFMPGILSVGEGRDLEEKDTALKEGENISIVVHMAGG